MKTYMYQNKASTLHTTFGAYNISVIDRMQRFGSVNIDYIFETIVYNMDILLRYMDDNKYSSIVFINGHNSYNSMISLVPKDWHINSSESPIFLNTNQFNVKPIVRL